ncbi:MAG: hypothetical protein SGPRY_001405, partial [Prymnesium sp.]
MFAAKRVEDDESIWQDRDIRFDTPTGALELRAGESRIDSINSVEDTKARDAMGLQADCSSQLSGRKPTFLQAVYRAYDTSRLYRELKLRGAIIKNKQLQLLPNEQVFNTVREHWSGIRMKLVRVRDSKFGQALVIETNQRFFQEVQSLHRVFSATPIFGVEFTIEEKAGSLTDLTVERQQDDIEIVDADSSVDPHKAYFAD